MHEHFLEKKSTWYVWWGQQPAVSFLGRLTKFVEKDSKVLVIKFLLLITYRSRCFV